MLKLRRHIVWVFIGLSFYTLALGQSVSDSFAIYQNKSNRSIEEADFEASATYLKKALQFTGNIGQKAEAHNDIGISLFNLSDYHSAIKHYDTAFMYSRQVKDTVRVGIVYNNYALAYTQLMRFDTAIYFYTQAKPLIDAKYEGVIYYNIAKCYEYMGNTDSSKVFFEKAYHSNTENFGEDNYYSLLTVLALAEIKGKLSPQIERFIIKSDNEELLGLYYSMIGENEKAENLLQSYPKRLIKFYVKNAYWKKAVGLIDTLRLSLSVESKLFLQANERLIFKNCIDTYLQEHDTLGAFKVALKSHSNVLKDEMDLSAPGEYPAGVYNYLDFDSVIYLFVTDRHLKAYKIFSDSVFQENYEAFLATLNFKDISNNFMQNYRQYAQSSHYLYKKLLPEVRGNIRIIPEGRLFYIPFEALLTKIPDTTQYPNYRSLSYLAKTSAISYDFLLRNYPQSIEEFKIVGLAPDLSLTYAKREVEYLKRYKSNIFIGKKATINALHGKSILHIATHFDPMDFKIGFVDDSLDLTTLPENDYPLVVLSTCYSGLGDFYTGEGVFSASRSFYKAGAQSVIESLWPNTDKSSYLIFKNFYNNLHLLMPRDEALNKAKLQYLDECVGYLTHPYFWANVRLFGDNSEVRIAKSYKKYYLLILIPVILIVLVVCIKYFLRHPGI